MVGYNGASGYEQVYANTRGGSGGGGNGGHGGNGGQVIQSAKTYTGYPTSISGFSYFSLYGGGGGGGGGYGGGTLSIYAANIVTSAAGAPKLLVSGQRGGFAGANGNATPGEPGSGGCLLVMSPSTTLEQVNAWSGFTGVMPAPVADASANGGHGALVGKPQAILLNPPSLSRFPVVFNLGTNGNRTGGGELNQQVITGGAAIPPTVSANAGLTFQGWDRSFDVVNGPLVVNAVYSAEVRITQGRVHNGMFSFTIPGQPGSRAEVWASTDLVNWSLIGTVTNITGAALFQEPANKPRQFYRVRSLP